MNFGPDWDFEHYLAMFSGLLAFCALLIDFRRTKIRLLSFGVKKEHFTLLNQKKSFRHFERNPRARDVWASYYLRLHAYGLGAGLAMLVIFWLF